MPGTDCGPLTRKYTKPALSHDELVDRWAGRGLVIPDRDRALRYVRTIGYFRLSAYVRSFENGQRDVVIPGTSFDDVLALYVFDRKLRLVVLDPLERVEVAVRASLSDRMSEIGGPDWYESQRFVKNAKTHKRLLREVDCLIEQEARRRRERTTGPERFPSALEHYVSTYDEPRRPPSWLMLEEVGFGTLVHVVKELNEPAVRGEIAQSLGVTARVLDSWLPSYLRVRNICAHHGRLWNRGLGVYPMIPTSRRISWLEDRTLFERDPWRRQRLYPVLASLQTVLRSLSPGSRWAVRLADLMSQAPAKAALGMGMPDDWRDDGFWRL